MLPESIDQLIQRHCPSKRVDAVVDLLSRECSIDLPLVAKGPDELSSDAEPSADGADSHLPPQYRWPLIERIQAAALRGTRWNLEKIRANVELAKIDWRDLLVQADFHLSVDGHKAWLQRAIQTGDLS